jgi:hypothetical protein
MMNRAFGFTAVAAVAGLAAPALAQAPAADAGASEPSLASLQAQLAAQQKQLDAQAAELDDLKAAAPVEPAEARPLPLHIWGYADMGINYTSGGNTTAPDWPSSANASFVLGNVEVYMDFEPIEHWSAFLEIGLTYLPNGNDTVTQTAITAGQANGSASSGFSRVNSITNDYGAPGLYSPAVTSAMLFERAYLQWAYNDLLTLRVGLFLTPFGIWNIDHGTPTLISLNLPWTEILELFPTHLIGLEALGSTYLHDWQLGYFAYLSNGRIPSVSGPAQNDVSPIALTNDNWIVGARAFAKTSDPVHMMFGVSSFYGHDADITRTLGVDANLAVNVASTVTSSASDFGLGIDASLDLGALRLRGELMYRSVGFDQGEQLPALYGGGYAPNYTQADGYLLVAYQLPWLGLEPYMFAELADLPVFTEGGDFMLEPGFNVHINSNVQIKFQYLWGNLISSFIPYQKAPGWTALQEISARLVMAFN